MLLVEKHIGVGISMTDVNAKIS